MEIFFFTFNVYIMKILRLSWWYVNNCIAVVNYFFLNICMYVSCIELNINSIRVCKNNKNLIILKITLRYINKLYIL